MPERKSDKQADDQRDERWLTLGVGSIGATSLLSDSGHEMVTAVLPSFITTVLGGSAAWLGVIEGFSDAITGVTKVVGGPLADNREWRARTASGGYLVTAIATAAIGFTVAIWQAGMLRAVAWAARGFRSPARDSMLASLASPRSFGRAFGVERAGDNLGAVVGPLLAGLLVAWIGIRPTIWLSIVPGLLAAVAITIAARQARRVVRAEPGQARGRLIEGYRRLRGTGLARALVPSALFEAGNLAATLLILRGNGQLMAGGMSPAAAVGLTTLLYAAHNAAAALISPVAGAAIDRVGPRRVLATGAFAYLLAYVGFATFGSAWWLLVLFVLSGCGIGFAETAQSVIVAHAVPDVNRGSGFGVLGLVQAAGDLVATVIGGILFTLVSPAACFIYAAAWMAASLLASLVVPRNANRIRHG